MFSDFFALVELEQSTKQDTKNFKRVKYLDLIISHLPWLCAVELVCFFFGFFLISLRISTFEQP